MKFDNIIIGGGLAGLISGIRLQEKGHNCAIVSAGQSALHFSSGSFDLLSNLPDGTEVTHPLEAIDRLEPNHPYRFIGKEAIARHGVEFVQLMKRAGITLIGNMQQNHYHFTPMGTTKQTWLTLDDFTVLSHPDALPWKRVVIINFPGFLDFYTKFIADEFEKHGVACKLFSVSLPAIDRIRQNPTEMRSANIAKAFDNPLNIEALAQSILPISQEAEAIVMPAVFGITSNTPLKTLKERLGKPLCTLATMPPSVPGIRMQQMLYQYFTRLGGTFMLGDTVEHADVEQHTVRAVYTTNHADIPLCADNYILATGSFFSRGIIARIDSVYEPIFNLDVAYNPDRSQWYSRNVFAPQEYMTFGVTTTPAFQAIRQGIQLTNLYAVGSILAGHNALHEGCGGGVSILSAMHVTEKLSK